MKRHPEGGYVAEYRGETYRVRLSLDGWKYAIEPFGWEPHIRPTKSQAEDAAKAGIDRLIAHIEKKATK